MHKRIVIKIGTGVITESERLNETVMREIVRQIAELKRSGTESIVITSGAVSAGKATIISKGSVEGDKQVYAAIGQPVLMGIYAKLFREEGFASAQVLVTKEDFRDRDHYKSMKECFENLLRENIIPIVNENDVIARHALSFSDNDELAGLVASQLDAEAVLMLTTVEGFLADSKGEKKLISQVSLAESASLEAHVTNMKSESGRGGMRRKFEIAKRLMAAGVTTYIADGTKDNIIIELVEGIPHGTKFMPDKKLSGIKRRLAHSEGMSVGSVTVNKGAEEILISGGFKSLLPVGIIKVGGSFKKGDTIEILGEKGQHIGHGVAQYDSEKAEELRGKKGGRALVHYDYMFVG
jgi:glutamate 5-kinase